MNFTSNIYLNSTSIEDNSLSLETRTVLAAQAGMHILSKYIKIEEHIHSPSSVGAEGSYYYFCSFETGLALIIGTFVNFNVIQLLLRRGRKSTKT